MAKRITIKELSAELVKLTKQYNNMKSGYDGVNDKLYEHKKEYSELRNKYIVASKELEELKERYYGLKMEYDIFLYKINAIANEK